MEYKEIEQAWQSRVAQLSARYESEIVAITLSNKDELKHLQEENERLRYELVEARGPESTAANTEADPTP